MSLICALSNVLAYEPVISPVSGNLFERRLIVKYLKENDNHDPLNGRKLEESQLIALNDASRSNAPGRQEDECSVSELVRLLQEQWDALTLERFNMNKDLNHLTKQLSSSTREKEILVREKQMLARDKEMLTKEREILLSQQNELCKFVEILNGKLTKYRQLDERRRSSIDLNLNQPKNDNLYSNLPIIENNKENIVNFSSSINSSNGSRCGTEPGAIQLDHSRFGQLVAPLSVHLSGGQHPKNGHTNGHSPNFSSINSKFSDTNVFFNEQHLASLASHAKLDNLPSPKFGLMVASGPKFIDHLPGGSKFNGQLSSPKLENHLPNSIKSSTLAKNVKYGSQLPNGGASVSPFQKYNKLSYSTEYVNLNGSNPNGGHRLFDRSHRTQSVIIQNDSMFDSGLVSMRSCEENLNYRHDRSNIANNCLYTSSSGGSLKRYGSNGTFNGNFNATLNSHCSANYVNTGRNSRTVEEEIYCNLPVISDEFDRTSLTSRRPKSAMIDYENILMFEDNPRNNPQNARQLERCTQPNRNEISNEARNEVRNEARNEFKHDPSEAKKNEELIEKVSNIESWSKDFKNLLKDPIGKTAFTVSFS